MKHFVLLKFEPSYLTEEIYLEIETAFAELKKALPDDVLAAIVHKNIIARESNMDIMIEMELKSSASLPTYLNHPIHQAIGAKMNPHITNRVSFDY